MTEQDKLKEAVLVRLKAKEINGTIAADILGVTVRHVRRLKQRFKKGVANILHKNRGRTSNHALDTKLKDYAIKLIQTKYPDFGPTLACEKLLENHQIDVSVESIRILMAKHKLWTPKPQRQQKHPHLWRARKDCYGQMQQYDGSYHNWFEGRLIDARRTPATKVCLLASIDDATGKLTHLKFASSEGVKPTFEFWQEYFKTHGKPQMIYLDRFSTYKNNLKKNIRTLELELTQFERAMEQLGVRVAHAKSPEAKGRVERLFQTLQDRLVKELRLNNVSTIEAANVYLQKVYIPLFNKKFAVVPKLSTNMHRQLTTMEQQHLSVICAVQEQRTIMHDYTISHNNTLYQILPIQKTLVRVNDRVTVCTKLDGSRSILKQDQELEFTEIKERPKKVTAIKTFDRRLLGHKPKDEHPWKSVTLTRQKIVQMAAVGHF